MSTSHTRNEIARSYTLWAEYVDPHATMTREEFDAMSESEKLRLMDEAFGVDSDEGVDCERF